MVQIQNEKSTTVPVTRGLYVLRYIKAKDKARPPAVFVQSSPGMEEDIAIITAPDLPDDKLIRPGTGLVISVYRAGYLVILVRSQRPAGSVEAELRLEALSREGDPVWHDSYEGQARGRTGDQGAWAAQEPDEGRFLFHLARQGDVLALLDEWAGGPDAPAFIEGMELQAPEGIQLEYQVLAGGANQRWSAWAADGEYAGSRGAALYLTGVRLRIAGAEAERFVLDVDAVFLDSSQVHKRGASVSLLSATGTEPLVGLRIGLKPRTQAASRAAPRSAPSQRRPMRPEPAPFEEEQFQPEPEPFRPSSARPAPPAAAQRRPMRARPMRPEPPPFEEEPFPSESEPFQPAPARPAPAAPPAAETSSRPRVRVFRASRTDA